VQLWPGPLTKRLLAERKWIGLGFATSHTAHLAGIMLIAPPDFGAFVRAAADECGSDARRVVRWRSRRSNDRRASGAPGRNDGYPVISPAGTYVTVIGAQPARC
jgi:hypothetical protein